MAGNLTGSKLIAAPPALITSATPAVQAFLEGLPAPDFNAAADWKTQWAVKAGAAEGTVGHREPGTAWVVSAETYRRLKARRYS